MKRLVFKYDIVYKVNNGSEEIMPHEITLPIIDENGFKVLRFTEEIFNDIFEIAKKQGLNISIEEK